MSKIYSAGQYEEPFYPHHSQFYGPVKKKIPHHPKTKTSTTHIIANDRGHLLPGQATVPGDCPWSKFVGTWDMPCHPPGNSVDDPVGRSNEGYQYLQRNKAIFNAALNVQRGNKSYSAKKRVSLFSCH
ncbi:hypothetical protein FBUS_10150 [Fasciolopsis buskii]|uniref:Cilia- and flagella-associated protein 126 n=1 Tax=Fasciolopsis buskii TaxID=27845 RepID=A0A8E0RY16_9TREM|nr:hypothetical protein FBUS_10150 [Fasciolopsis buski]